MQHLRLDGKDDPNQLELVPYLCCLFNLYSVFLYLFCLIVYFGGGARRWSIDQKVELSKPRSIRVRVPIFHCMSCP